MTALLGRISAYFQHGLVAHHLGELDVSWVCHNGGMAVKQCSWDGCTAMAAYGTRTKPAWCDEHITAILRQGGLLPLEPFVSPQAYRLTRCLTCGCEAHYRFEY